MHVLAADPVRSAQRAAGAASCSPPRLPHCHQSCRTRPRRGSRAGSAHSAPDRRKSPPESHPDIGRTLSGLPKHHARRFVRSLRIRLRPAERAGEIELNLSGIGEEVVVAGQAAPDLPRGGEGAPGVVLRPVAPESSARWSRLCGRSRCRTRYASSDCDLRVARRGSSRLTSSGASPSVEDLSLPKQRICSSGAVGLPMNSRGRCNFRRLEDMGSKSLLLILLSRVVLLKSICPLVEGYASQFGGVLEYTSHVARTSRAGWPAGHMRPR